MKKGFTLIELLAVIVILAIIALIAVPIVLNIINNSKDSANKRSIEMYAKAIQNNVMKESLKNKGKIDDMKGTYHTTDNKTITSTTNEENVIIVNYKGKEIVCNYIEIHEDGTVYLEDCLIGDYSVTKEQLDDILDGESNKKTYSHGKPKYKKICKPTKNVTVGKIPSGNYEYGDEYICELGDGKKRTFFVLENGDNTPVAEEYSLTKPGEVSLIMNENYDDSILAFNSKNGLTPDDLMPKLNEIRALWKKIHSDNINLPSRPQLYMANNKSTTLDQWAYVNLTETIPCYWTSYTYQTYARYATNVIWRGTLNDNHYVTKKSCGVRPVITLSKKDI